MVLAFVAAAIIGAGIIDTASPAASPAASAAIPDGTYTYEFRQSGAAIGTAVIAVKRSGGTIRTHEIATLSGRSFVVDQTLEGATFVPRSLGAVYPGAEPTASFTGTRRSS